MHVLRLPWLVHKSVHGADEKPPGTWYGILGVMAIAGLFIGGYSFGVTLWKAQPLGQVNMVISPVDSGAKDFVTQLRRNAESLRGKACPTQTVSIVNPDAVLSGQPQSCVVAQRSFPGEMYIARRDPQVRNVSLLMNGISYLLEDSNITPLGKPNPNCHLRITAPKDGVETAKTLKEMAETIRCQVDFRPSDDLQPEIEQEALKGAEDNMVVIHAPKGDQRYDNFVMRMNMIVHVKRVYDVYHAGQSDQAVWVQIGHGFPWHIENTYVWRLGAN